MITQLSLNESLKHHCNAIAVEESGLRFSYNDLLSNADKITNFLLKQGIGQQSIIGIKAKTIVEIIYSMIGIMNARCVFVAIDDSLPESRLRSLIQELGHPTILSGKNMPERNVYDHCKQFELNELIQQAEATDISYPEFYEDDSLYIYFTSGSTGKPKGIIGKNCSIEQFLRWEINTFAISANDRFSQFISPYFDAFLRDVFVPISVGATVCVPDKKENFFTPEEMTPWVEANGITHIHCVPSLFRILNNDYLTDDSFRSLKYVFLSGEKINPQELKPWYTVIGNRIQLVNLYGATETTMIRCYYEIDPKDVLKIKIPIGKPIDGTELLIADKNFKSCDVLQPGEVLILSDYMTKGYLNDPELTAAKFITISKAGKSWLAYKTGDLARMLIDGAIELLGREDRQIKINGIRVELDEIENIILQSGLVKNAVVTSSGEKEALLHAFFISENSDQQVTTNKIDHIRRYLEANLPGYMIPSQLIEVIHFPLLSNGKIDMKALTQLKPSKEIIPPATKKEEQLLDIWKDLLGNKPISSDDTFQTIGGNSLLLMRLISKIYTVFHVRVTLLQLSNNLTIKSQADLIGRLHIDKEDVYTVPKGEVKPFYPLSSSQATIYYNYEVNRESTAYNMPMVIEILDKVDTGKIQTIFRTLIKRHESLRTGFTYQDDKVVQFISDDVDFNLKQRSIPVSQLENEISGFPKPFNLNTPSLLRAEILNSTSNNYLLVDVHHIICDGLSQQILFKEFIELYNDHPLKTPPVQYRDYVEWEQNFRIKQEFILLREFWLKAFEGEIPKLGLFKKHTTLSDKKNEGSNFDFTIDKTTIQLLVDKLSKDRMTISSGLFSILQLLLYKVTGQTEMVIGILNTGRLQEELESMIGIFVKVLPIKCKIKMEESFINYAEHVHKYLSEANNNQLYNLIDLMADLKNNRQHKSEPLFDVLFNFQISDTPVVPVQKVPFAFCNVNEATSNYPLELKIVEEKDLLNFRFVYSLNYFNAEQIESLAVQYKSLIHLISEDTGAKIHEFFEESPAIISDDVIFNFGYQDL